MVKKNIVSNDNKTSSFKCPDNVKLCQYYKSHEKLESRCVKDSNLGSCTTELKQWEKEVDDFFKDYESSEVIREHGDIR